ncbi:uncharacterized protein LOC111017811 [Momordica charantia]|uniref:Uncharacterized protein LOC111017811 n=1 Tax=Momordica charantia TaxID=3673 RepID=A0A6J1D875_MOMCH|nr:uncharacterized protein LOC111017811 [Momordica charantia]
MVVLSRMLNRSSPSFRFHEKCDGVALTHLCFADDLMIFSRADFGSLSFVNNVLASFGELAGLVANTRKSSFFGTGIPDVEVEQLAAFSDFSVTSFPVRYLGVPLFSCRLSHHDCQPLLEQIVSRVWSWSARMFSFASRLQLIQSILQSFQSRESRKVVECASLGFLEFGHYNEAALVALYVGWLYMGWLYVGGLIFFLSEMLFDLWFDLRLEMVSVVLFGMTLGFWMSDLSKDWREDVLVWIPKSSGLFSVSSAWDVLRPTQPLVPWFSSLWFSGNISKHSFIAWLAVRDRLATLDRLRRWDSSIPVSCVFCVSFES